MKNSKLKFILLLFLIGCISIFTGAYLNKILNKNSFFTSNDIKKAPTEIFYSAIGTNINNQNVSLSKYKKEWLLVNFWATWCAPCKEEIPDLNILFNENKQSYPQAKIRLIGIAIDEIEAVKKFITKIPIHYDSLIFNDIKGVEIAKSLGNTRGVLPFTVLINPNGKIINTIYGKTNIKELRILSQIRD